MSLTVGYFSNFLFFVPEEGPPRGIEGLLFTILMETLGMRYELFTAIELSGNATKVKSLLWHVYRGPADLAVSSRLITFRNMARADCTIPYIYSSVKFVTNLPEMQPRTYAFLHSFDKTTWLLTATTSLVAPVAFGALFGFRDFPKTLLIMIGNLLGRSSTLRLRGRSQAIFTVVWWFGTLVLVFSFCSMVLSCLTVPIMDEPPANFKELAEAVREGRYRVFVRRTGDILRRTLETSSNPDALYLAEAMKKNDWYWEGEYLEGFEPHTAYFYNTFHLLTQYGRKPFNTMHYSEDGIGSFYIGIMVNKRLPHLKKKMDVIISRIQQSGLLNLFIENQFYAEWLHSPSHQESEDPIRPISLNDLSGAFYVLAIGLSVSTVVFILEYVSKKFRLCSE